MIMGAVQMFTYLTPPLFFRKLKPVIIDAVQIFELVQQNCLVFAKISARDNRGSSNFQITSRKLLYFCQNFTSQ